MKSLVVLLTVVISVVLSAPPSSIDDGDLSPKIILIDDLEQYMRDNPDGEWQELTKEVSEVSDASGRYVISYTIGNRNSNDRLVGQVANSQSWSSPQNIRLTITYPTSGVGAIVGFAQVVVEQSTTTGNAFVQSGGIGQRSIVVIVNAAGTNFFNYAGQIWGRD